MNRRASVVEVIPSGKLLTGGTIIWALTLDLERRTGRFFEVEFDIMRNRVIFPIFLS